MSNKQRISFSRPDSHIKMMTIVEEPEGQFRILMQAPDGGYFGALQLTLGEMGNLREAIDKMLSVSETQRLRGLIGEGQEETA